MTPAHSAVPAMPGETRTGFWHEVGDFVRQFIVAAFDPYRPERHYMRGPGPAWRARRDASS